jgi:hypothetical protein
METSAQLYTPAALPPRKEPPVPTGWGAGRVPNPVLTYWRKEKIAFFAPAGNRTLAVQPVVLKTG